MISARRKKNPGKLPGLGRPILPAQTPRQAWIEFLQDCLPFLRRPPHLQQAYRRVGQRVAAPPVHRQVVPRGSPGGFADTVPGGTETPPDGLAEELQAETGPQPQAGAGPDRGDPASPPQPPSSAPPPAAG